jgi:hypothetical protein
VEPEGGQRRGRRRRQLFGCLLVAVLLLGAVLVGGSLGADRNVAAPLAARKAPPAAKFHPQPGRNYLTDADVRQIRKAVRTQPVAKAAWAQTKAAADAALGHAPNPAPSAGADYSETGRDAAKQCTGTPSGWACLLYARGLHDGLDTLNLARAYAVTGRSAYALKAKEFLLAWARTYNPPNPTVAQDIAEPGGFMLKGFMAFDLVQDVFTAPERSQFTRWAQLFVAEGEARADHQIDAPGLPDQVVGGETSNWQRYGNSQTFSRALAVAAAAVVGGSELRSALAWNWSHRTPGGHDNGWPRLIDGEIIDGTGGETFEGRGRNDISYGLLGSDALLVVADVAKHAGYGRDLFAYTTRRGDSVLSPFAFYGKYLNYRAPWPRSDGAYGRKDSIATIYRAATEVALRNTGPKLRARLAQTVSYGGTTRRGANLDPYVWGYSGLVETIR